MSSAGLVTAVGAPGRTERHRDSEESSTRCLPIPPGDLSSRTPVSQHCRPGALPSPCRALPGPLATPLQPSLPSPSRLQAHVLDLLWLFGKRLEGSAVGSLELSPPSTRLSLPPACAPASPLPQSWPATARGHTGLLALNAITVRTLSVAAKPDVLTVAFYGEHWLTPEVRDSGSQSTIPRATLPAWLGTC